MMYVSGSDKILTFAETDADLTTDKTVGSVSVPAIPANVQGLHFRWGSLVGVTSNGTSGATFTQNRPVFWPTEYTAPSTWVYNNNGVSVTGQVPYIAGAEIGTQSNEEYDAFVTYNSNTGYDKANAKGDVCRYITDQGWVDGKWRMPTTSEMRMLYNETYAAISNYNGKVIGWDTSHETISNTGTDNKYGYYEIPDVRIVGAGVSSSSTLASPGAGTVVIPASGHRRNSDGMLDFPGFYGYCWSATPSSTAEGAYNLHYTGTTGANPALSSHRTYGFSVRCIQETY